MATKWKNMTEKIKTGFHKERTRKILGSIFGVFGILVLGVLIKYQVYYITTTSMTFGVVGNVSLCIALCLLAEPYLQWKYVKKISDDSKDDVGNGITDSYKKNLKGQQEKGEAIENSLQNQNEEALEEEFETQNGNPNEEIVEENYETWLQKRKSSYRTLYITGAMGAILSMIYMWGIMNFYNLYWGHNYSAGYVMMLTVLIQFIVAQILLKNFWTRRLNQMMEQIELINQKRIAEALEIEKKSLEKVSRSDQLRVDLITNVSHDLKTPLTSMVGYLELIKKEELNDTVRDYVDVISARAEKLGEMINSLFNLAKASSGNIEFHKEKFEMNRLLEQIFADMQDRVKESQLTFVKQYTKESTAVLSDNTYYYRICQNLIENTLKYAAKGTRVFVKTSIVGAGDGLEGNAQNLLAEGMDRVGVGGMTKRKICVEITNTSAYPMDFEKEDIVERFARGDKNRSSEGNGLGLAIVSTYAKALGGEFDIKIDCDQFKACLICGDL